MRNTRLTASPSTPESFKLPSPSAAQHVKPAPRNHLRMTLLVHGEVYPNISPTHLKALRQHCVHGSSCTTAALGVQMGSLSDVAGARLVPWRQSQKHVCAFMRLGQAQVFADCSGTIRGEAYIRCPSRQLEALRPLATGQAASCFLHKSAHLGVMLEQTMRTKRLGSLGLLQEERHSAEHSLGEAASAALVKECKEIV